MPDYTEICRVALPHRNLPVNLLLQLRHNVPQEGRDYFCLSWRTRLPNGRQNRQGYYLQATGVWKIPVRVAVRLLNQAYRKGWLNELFDDPQRRHRGPVNTIIDSRFLNGEEYERELNSIIKVDWEDRERDWGPEPVFVIIQVPDETWRKIMMVHTDREVCTFRSATTEPSYPKRVDTGMIPPWGIDHSMQDASSAMMRTFRQVLLEIQHDSARAP